MKGTIVRIVGSVYRAPWCSVKPLDGPMTTYPRRGPVQAGSPAQSAARPVRLVARSPRPPPDDVTDGTPRAGGVRRGHCIVLPLPGRHVHRRVLPHVPRALRGGRETWQPSPLPCPLPPGPDLPGGPRGRRSLRPVSAVSGAGVPRAPVARRSQHRVRRLMGDTDTVLR